MCAPIPRRRTLLAAYSEEHRFLITPFSGHRTEDAQNPSAVTEIRSGLLLRCTAPSSSNDVLDCWPRPRATHATARVYHPARQRSSSVAARSAGAACKSYHNNVPRASPVGLARVVVVDPALGRLYPVSCALQVSDGILPRLRPRAFPARSLRRPPNADGCLKLVSGPHWVLPIFRADRTKPNIFGAVSRTESG